MRRMDFTDPQLIARLQAFEQAADSLGGEYENITANWGTFVRTADALAEMSPQATLINDWYNDADEGAAFPDGEAAHDAVWYEMWYAYCDFRALILTEHHRSWVAQANAIDKLWNSFGDVRSFFPSWDWEHGIWKS